MYSCDNIDHDMHVTRRLQHNSDAVLETPRHITGRQ